VIGPAEVVRSALENALSAASLPITNEAAIAEKPGKPAPMPAMPPGGGIGGMGGMCDGMIERVVWTTSEATIFGISDNV
jgi:hypothetical protein